MLPKHCFNVITLNLYIFKKKEHFEDQTRGQRAFTITRVPQPMDEPVRESQVCIFIPNYYVSRKGYLKFKTFSLYGRIDPALWRETQLQVCSSQSDKKLDEQTGSHSFVCVKKYVKFTCRSGVAFFACKHTAALHFTGLMMVLKSIRGKYSDDIRTCSKTI